MNQGKYLKLNLPDYTDAADIEKLVENFEILEGRAPAWTDFSNSGTVLESTGNFTIATAFPVGEENTIFAVTAKMPRAFAEDDTITVDDVVYNLYQGTDPALSEAWKAGEVVTINFDKTSRRCWASAGGGAPRPLPAQVSNMQASTPEGETPTIVFTWTNPVDENFAGMILVVKEGSAPNGVTDGTQVYKGTGTTFTYTEGVQFERTYYGRGFAYNSQDKFQMDATGAIASATPTNTPAVATNFQISTDFDEATMTWENPDSLAYFKTIIMQKIGGIPQSITDGTEVYSGTETSTKVTGLQDKVAYYWRAFTVSATNKYNKNDAPHVTYTPRLVPDSWGFEKCITGNEEWTPDTKGIYRVTCIGASANGTTGSKGTSTTLSEDKRKYTSGSGGNGGGAGGIARSELILDTSESIHCTVSSSISSFGDFLSATSGSGINGGTGIGGNDFNTTGNLGGTGGVGFSETVTIGSSSSPTSRQKPGNRGGGNGALGGSTDTSSYYYNGAAGGGGGGGATYALPDDIKYDDVLYTTYIVRDLGAYSGGNGEFQKDGTAGSSYPAFSASSPVWYGGGNGGGGGHAYSNPSGVGTGGAGSAGSPGGILIEKGVFN